MTEKKKKKPAMPDTLIIVASVVLLVAILSWIIPVHMITSRWKLMEESEMLP